MFPCTFCGARTIVYDSRPNPGSPTGIVRRRDCPQCRNRFTTREIADADFLPLRRAADVIRRIREMVG